MNTVLNLTINLDAIDEISDITGENYRQVLDTVVRSTVDLAAAQLNVHSDVVYNTIVEQNVAKYEFYSGIILDTREKALAERIVDSKLRLGQ